MVGQVRACGGPFISDGKGAVDKFADEGFAVGGNSGYDGLRGGLGKGLVDELPNCVALEADAAVHRIALRLVGVHGFQ